MEAAWITTTDAGRILGVSRTTVHRMLLAGALPFRRFPTGRRKIPRDAVLALAARLDQAGEPQPKEKKEPRRRRDPRANRHGMLD